MDVPQSPLAHIEETESVDLQSRVSTACIVLCVLCMCLSAGVCGYYIGAGCERVSQRGTAECLSAEKVREVADFVGMQRSALVAAMAGAQWTERTAREMQDSTLRLMARLKTIHL